MQNELNSTQILHAYEVVMANGDATELGKSYQGIEAYSDYDGYNVYLRGHGVELHVGFHNTYNLDYDHERSRDVFLTKIASLAK